MGLNQLFDHFLGGQPASAQSADQANGIAGIAGRIPAGLTGGLAAGGVLGLLAGNKKLRKSAGKLAGGAAGIGGGAALGALAYSAYRNWQKAEPSGQSGGAGATAFHGSAAISTAPSSPPPDLAKFDPENNIDADGHPFQLALVKAMIAAANADGHMDEKELQAVFGALNGLRLDTGDKALIFDTLRNPPDIDTIAGFANGLEQASELYMVSRLAIDPDHPAEQAYLDNLSDRLQLPAGLVAQIEGQIAVAQSEAA